MPYKIRKRKCKQSNNLVGDYIVVKIKPSGKEEKVSCHKTKEKARGAISAKHAASNNEIVKISVDMLRKIIKEEVESVFIVSEGLRTMPNTQEVDLKWYRDGQNRFIEVIHSNGWLFQRDDSVPALLSSSNILEIASNEWRRIVNDNDRLTVKTVEKNE
jgi:hypothetical protein